jgi:hypothetical protein
LNFGYRLNLHPVFTDSACDPQCGVTERIKKVSRWEVDVADSDLDELERYRRAAEDALQQLDWCIGYLHGIRKNGEARVLARNRQTIRTNLLLREDEPTPA